MKKLLKRDNWGIIFLTIMLLLVVLAAITTKTKVFNAYVQDMVAIIEPSRIEEDRKMTTYYLKPEHVDERGNTLLFYTNHQIVDVYADDVLIYSARKSTSVFGRTSGAIWNSMALPVPVEEIRVVMIPVFSNLEAPDVEFRLGNGVHMLITMVRESIGDVAISLAIYMIGIALVFYWLVVFRFTGIQKEVLYFGLFAIVFASWSFGESELAGRLIANRPFASYMAFSCLMSMAVPFVLFIREIFALKNSKLHRYILGYSVLIAALCQILHITGIAGVKQTVVLTISTIVIGLLYLMYAVVIALKTGENKKIARVNIYGLIVLAIGAFIDSSNYLNNDMNAKQFGKIGVLIYVVMLAAGIATRAQAKLKEAHQIEIYREMAEKDMLTQCFNRNAYNKDVQEMTRAERVQVLTFDMNNLKKHNDEKGHIEGDQYIIDCAKIISDVFGGLGKVYRVGGDEFCVLTFGQPETVLEEKKAQLWKIIEETRIQTEDPDFGIAFGYASYDKNMDLTLEDTRSRADARMYENKKEIKGIK